jgi:hypothetical protein
MLKRNIALLIAGGLLSAQVALPAFAVGNSQVAESIALKDGSTVYIFKDGKMGMADQFGRATVMEQGRAMETRGGKKITMSGNEVWRVSDLRRITDGE